MAAPAPATPTPPKPPLGLPTGSVRAILALVLSGTLWYTILRGIPPEPILVESALLVVAFYFGVRSTAPVVPTQRPVPAPGAPKPRQPLFLPRGFVRTTLAAGFLGVIAYVFLRGGTIDQSLVLILQVILSYVVGYATSWALLRRVRKGKELGRAARAARNLISLAAIGVTGGVCWAIATGRFDVVPEYLRNGLAWTVAFYFGSRVSL